MLGELFDEIIQEWRSSYKSRFHPFKYSTLTTVSEDGFPRSRTVVVREIHENHDIVIFTDSRSNKARQISSNPKACLLAYHPKKLKQLRWDGNLVPITDPAEVKRLFQKVSQKSLKDYTTLNPPGHTIANPDLVDYVTRKEAHFLPLKFVPAQVEYLQLKRPNHLRALYKKDEGWNGTWLTP